MNYELLCPFGEGPVVLQMVKDRAEKLSQSGMLLDTKRAKGKFVILSSNNF